MVKASEAMSARARARQAKAELDAQRAEQDRLIVDKTTEFYEAAEALAAAQAAAAAAEQQRSTAVARLVEIGQTETQIATLCGLTAKEVRDLRRRAAAIQPRNDAPPKTGASAPEGAEDGGTEPADQTTVAA